MRITVVPTDSRVVINGEGYNDIDLSSIDPSIHAIQWYDTEGEVEIKDARGRMIENREITSFDEFASVITLWEEAKAQDLANKAAAKVAQETRILNQPPLPQ